MTSPRFGKALLLTVSLLLPVSASALPVTYTFNSGSVTLTATVSGSLVSGPATTALSGLSVTVDETALTLDSMTLTMGSLGPVPILPPYLGFTSINIDFASLSASGGTLTPVDPGPPSEYSYVISGVTVSGQLDAVNLVPVNSLNNQPFGFVNPSASGTIFIDPFAGTLDLDGITLGVIDPDGPGGAAPLVIKGDFTFSGEVPEPGVVSLLGTAALAGLVSARRRLRI